MLRRVVTLTTAGLLTALVACGDDGINNTTPQPPRGIIVLDGFIQPGLTFLGDTGSASSKLTLGPTTEFDAGGFTLLRDTVLTVSSRGAGDLLYVTDVRTSTTRRIQLPTRSNPSRARLLAGTGGQTLIGAALRDSASIALLSFSGAGTPTSTRIANAGTCPTDLFQFDNATWIVDANANCKVNYAVQGDVRLIRVPNTGTTRDTILLPGLRGSGASALVDGELRQLSVHADLHRWHHQGRPARQACPAQQADAGQHLRRRRQARSRRIPVCLALSGSHDVHGPHHQGAIGRFELRVDGHGRLALAHRYHRLGRDLR
jgi:hypothetical protein